MALEIAGVSASLRWGYSSAATLGAWSVTKREDGCWTLRSVVIVSDTFRVAQRPLVFEAAHAKGSWRWPVLELQAGEGSLTATLGPHEGDGS
jgi:hypothetical protein